jgi:NAD+ synthase (glutamine-hydrolysing)
VLIRSAKHHLPNYGVFDEYRYFVPGDVLPVVRIGGVDTADRDLRGPVAGRRPGGGDRRVRRGLLVSINASPYELAKDDERYELMRERAIEAGCTLAYVNQVGAQDELVFDGDSLVVAAGRRAARPGRAVRRGAVHPRPRPARVGPAGRGDHRLERHDDPSGGGERRAAAALPRLRRARPVVEERLDDLEEIYQALCVGLRDYVRKNGFRTVLFGLSGGIDSALVAAIAVDAVGAENTYAVSMPSGYSSEHSKSDAADLAQRTGLHFETVLVAPMVDAYLKTIADTGTAITGVADENLQARVRGTILMALSNQRGHLVLATGNKSELSVGYATLYDAGSIGGFSPIKDVPKTLVWELARWRNAEAERRGQTPPIPVNSIEKEPSAELRPGQKDSDSLPDYALLDGILDLYVKGDKGLADIIAAGYDPALAERVLRLTDGAEYKRRQYPPGTKISPKAFGRDRRLPITNKYVERAGES